MVFWQKNGKWKTKWKVFSFSNLALCQGCQRISIIEPAGVQYTVLRVLLSWLREQYYFKDINCRCWNTKNLIEQPQWYTGWVCTYQVNFLINFIFSAQLCSCLDKDNSLHIWRSGLERILLVHSPWPSCKSILYSILLMGKLSQGSKLLAVADKLPASDAHW